MLTVVAPAKLNLTLEILGKREDGYHEVRSVVQTVDLCDRLRFRTGEGTRFVCGLPGWEAERSLLPGAVEMIRRATGCNRGVTIEAEKNIPLMAGLGGESSDAAGVLRGLNQWWDLNLPQSALLELAASLGSDVPLFLYGGTVLVEGRGEKVAPLPPLPPMWVLLVLPRAPREPGKTARAYARLEPRDFTDGHATGRLMDIIKAGGGIEPRLLSNVFERTVLAASPELQVCRREMIEAGAGHAHLAGSGPALFALFAERASAESLRDRLRTADRECYLAQTLAAGGAPG